MIVKRRREFRPSTFRRTRRQRPMRSFVAVRATKPIFRRRRANVRTGGFTNIERKFFDTMVDSVATGALWTTLEPATTNLSAIGIGDGESNRDGRKYNILSIHVKGFLELSAVEAEANPTRDILVRICLVLDTQTNGAQLTATDVMEAQLANNVNSFRNLQFTSRFRVLKDKTIRIPVTGLNEGAPNAFARGAKLIPFKMNSVFSGGIPVLMSGTTADIANVTTNSLHFIAVSTSATALVSYTSRVRFTG